MSVDRRGYVVRLRGLPFSTSAEEVVQFLTDRGSALVEIVRGVGGVTFMFSPEGKPTGEALVELQDEASMRMALRRHKEMLGSRFIELVG